MRQQRFLNKTSLITIAVSIVVWSLLTSTLISSQTFPGPRDVISAAYSLGANLFFHAWSTFWRVVLGLAIGTPFGIQMGLLMSRGEKTYSITNPFIESIRPIPPIALIPFFIIWFGTGWEGQVLLVALGCFMVMTVNTFVAVDNVSPIYIQAASILGASKAKIYRTIVRPAIFPDLISGLRISAALAFATGIAAEFMGAQSGLGFMIMVARRTLNTNTILLGIIIIAFEAFVVDWSISYFSKKNILWKEPAKQSIHRIQTLSPKESAR